SNEPNSAAAAGSCAAQRTLAPDADAASDALPAGRTGRGTDPLGPARTDDDLILGSGPWTAAGLRVRRVPDRLGTRGGPRQARRICGHAVPVPWRAGAAVHRAPVDPGWLVHRRFGGTAGGLHPVVAAPARPRGDDPDDRRLRPIGRGNP